MLQVLLGWLHSKSPPVALAVFLVFRCLLRTGKMLAVTARDIVIPSNSCSGVLYPGDTKIAGRNPNAGMVNLTDPTVVFLLKAWKSTVSPHTALIPWSSTKFRALFEEGLVATNLQHYKFKPYSLRRGGATDQWPLTKNYAQVSHLGRWSSEKTLKIYIQDSVALLTTLQFKSPPTQQRWTSYWLDKCRVEALSHRQKGGGRGRRSKWNVSPKKGCLIFVLSKIWLLNHVTSQSQNVVYKRGRGERVLFYFFFIPTKSCASTKRSEGVFL